MAFFYGKNMAIDPTLDPQKIAERNTITQSMDVAGSPDEFAKDPTQLAMGSLKGIKLLTDMFVQPPVSEPSKVFKPFKGADEYDDPNKVIAPGIVSQQPSRVPTGQETNIIPDRGNFNYKETQNEVAQRMVDQGILSNEGLERFRSRGFQSIQNQEELIKQDALSILDEANNFDAKTEEIINSAKKGVTAEKLDFKTDFGAASPTKAAQLQEYLKNNVKKVDDFNFDRIETSEDLTNTIQAMSKMLENDMSGFTGGTITNKETIEKSIDLLQDEVGLTKKIINRAKGETFGSAVLVAGRQLLIHSAKKLENLAKLIDNRQATDLDKLMFRRQLSIHSAIQAQMKGAQTEAARALQSFNIRVGTSIDEQISERAAASMLDQTMREDLTSGVVDKLATDLLKSIEINTNKNTGASGVLKGINSFAENSWWVRAKDQVHQAFMASILSSPATQAKNIIGNVAYMTALLPAELAAGIYGDLVRFSFPSGSKRTKALAKILGTLNVNLDEQFANSVDNVNTMDFIYRVASWMSSIRDATQAARLAALTNMPAKGSRLDLTPSMQASTGKSSVAGKAVDYVSKVFTLPFRFLLAGDEFFKTLAARGELGVQAHRKYAQILRQKKIETGGKLNKQDYQEAFEEGLMVYLDPKAIDDKLDTEAAKITLTSDLGKFGRLIGDVQNTALGRFIIPFSTAPTNDILNTTEFIPLINLLRPKTKKALFGELGPAEHQMAMGKMAFGMSVGYMMFELVSNGRFIGAKPRNEQARNDFDRAGKQPFSFVFKGKNFPDDKPLFDQFGNPNGKLNYVSIAGFGPLASVLSIYANTAELMLNSQLTNKDDTQTLVDLVIGSALSTFDVFREIPTLKSLNEIINAYEVASANVEDGIGSTRFAESMNNVFGISIVENFPFAFSSLQGAIERGRDPTVKIPRKDKLLITIDDLQNYTLENGEPNYSMLGLPKQDDMSKYINWSSWANSLIGKRTAFKKDELLVKKYDPLGNAYGADSISFSNNFKEALWNFTTGLTIKKSKALDDVEVELGYLYRMSGNNDYPLTNKKRLNGIILSPGQQSDFARLAKSKDINDEPVQVNDLYFYEALKALINNTLKGRLFNSSEYHNPKTTVKRKIQIIENLNNMFFDKAQKKFLDLPQNKNLKNAFLDKESQKERR